MQEGNLRLDNLSRASLADQETLATWQKAAQMLHEKAMPPEDADELTEKEHAILIRWIDAEIDRGKARLNNRADRVVLRRLNRLEYQNTMRDLFDVEMDYARDLPPDPAGRVAAPQRAVAQLG